MVIAVATIFAGTQSHGQGHQTAYAMLVADQTGIPVERITLVDGDTDRVPRGSGSHGSRSMRIGGTALVKSAGALLDRGRELAAEMLQAQVDAAQDVAGQRAGRVGSHRLAPATQGLCRMGVGRVGWLGGVDLGGYLGADRPGLGVGLVDKDSGERAHHTLPDVVSRVMPR